MDEQLSTAKPSTGTDRATAQARALELVCAMAMSLPSKAPGPLRYPPFRTLLAQR